MTTYKIKPLKWEWRERHQEWLAFVGAGYFALAQSKETGLWMILTPIGMRGTTDYRFRLDTAKRKAQQIWERHLLQVLEPVTDTET